MGIHLLTDAAGKTAIFDAVTEVPLPCPLFYSADAAEHFLLWCLQNEREPYAPTPDYYHIGNLQKSLKDWSGEFCPDGELTDEAYRQVMAHHEY